MALWWLRNGHFYVYGWTGFFKAAVNRPNPSMTNPSIRPSKSKLPCLPCLALPYPPIPPSQALGLVSPARYKSLPFCPRLGFRFGFLAQCVSLLSSRLAVSGFPPAVVWVIRDPVPNRLLNRSTAYPYLAFSTQGCLRPPSFPPLSLSLSCPS